MERTQIIRLVRAFGGSNTDAILDKTTQIFSTPEIEGFVGYRRDTDCYVIYGDPVARPEDKTKLAKVFHKFAEELGKSYIYIAATKEFSDWAIQNVCKVKIEFGREFRLDPSCDPRKLTGTHASLVRRKVRHAQKEGLVVEEYQKEDPKIEEQMEQVVKAWTSAHSGPKLHISHVHLFEDREGKRWFYARQNNKLVGLILLNQLKSYNGFLLNHLMTIPEAPHGTPEHLVVTVLEILEKEGCRFVTVGSVPSESLGKIEGLNLISSLFAHTVFQIARRIYKLQGLHKFWEKFHPQAAESYLLFSRNIIGIKELQSLKKSLNGTHYS